MSQQSLSNQRTFYYKVSEFNILEDPLNAEISIRTETGEEITIYLDANDAASARDKEDAELAHHEKRAGFRAPRQLNAAVVERIRHAYAHTEPILGRSVAIARLASRYRISASAIDSIVKGRTWASVGGPVFPPAQNLVRERVLRPARAAAVMEAMAGELPQSSEG